MAILVTRNWGSYDYVRGESARIQFVVTGVSTAEQARNVLPIKKGDTFEWDTGLIAKMPRVSTPDSPQVFQVDVDFEPDGSSNGGGDETLNQLPVYRLSLGTGNEPIDRDVFKNPILNSAGDPFADNVQRSFTTIHYEYTRFEKQYNVQLALALGNTINKDAVELPGAGRISPGQGKLDPPECLTDMTRLTNTVQVRYHIELREDGFNTRILDLGQQAVYANDPVKKGPIYNQQGENVPGDVLLNGGGLPLDPSLRINRTLDTPSNAVIPKHWKNAQTETSESAIYVRYQIYKEASWRALKFQR